MMKTRTIAGLAGTTKSVSGFAVVVRFGINIFMSKGHEHINKRSTKFNIVSRKP